MPDTSYYYPRFYLGLSEGEKRESGEIPSCDMCFDGRYYAVSGFITGAIGAKFPGMNHLVEGVVDTTVSAGERLRMQSLMTVCHGMRSGHMLLIQDGWWQIL